MSSIQARFSKSLFMTSTSDNGSIKTLSQPPRRSDCDVAQTARLWSDQDIWPWSNWNMVQFIYNVKTTVQIIRPIQKVIIRNVSPPKNKRKTNSRSNKKCTKCWGLAFLQRELMQMMMTLSVHSQYCSVNTKQRKGLNLDLDHSSDFQVWKHFKLTPSWDQIHYSEQFISIFFVISRFNTDWFSEFGQTYEIWFRSDKKNRPTSNRLDFCL